MSARKISAFDYMLEEGLDEYVCDDRTYGIAADHYESLARLGKTQVRYRKNVFVVVFAARCMPVAGRLPDRIKIVRVKEQRAPRRAAKPRTPIPGGIG